MIAGAPYEKSPRANSILAGSSGLFTFCDCALRDVLPKLEALNQFFGTRGEAP